MRYEMGYPSPTINVQSWISLSVSRAARRLRESRKVPGNQVVSAANLDIGEP
ncbi:hypothetical protein [Mycolicibacter arupensis]|uniref:hypothetical protein n=1 Tax=Mycolicibacter arupensis TaxID=342002 RepID=UPI0023F56525|nr:hypothetical protein [Mycolicibacter arupensis]